MKTITISFPLVKTVYPEIVHKISTLNKWIQRQEPMWEYNRFGIAAAGILIQVTFAGVMIAMVGLAHGSMWVATIGMLFAFVTNSVAFGQVAMRWLLGFFVLSITVNATIALFYATQLLQ